MMLIPAKYMDLHSSVINVSAVVLSQFGDKNVVGLDELEETIETRMGEAASYNFFPALSLLYALGKIDYDEKTDSIVATPFLKQSLYPISLVTKSHL